MNYFFTFLLSFFLTNSLLAEQEMCAMMLGDEIDTEEYSEVLDKKVYFCCGACVKAFDANTAYYIKALPDLAKLFTADEQKKLGVDKVKLLDQKFCPIYPDRVVNPNSKTIEYKGKKIYFWSSSAQRRWNRDPEKYFKEAFDKGNLPQYK